jgi:hypothetical protein
MSEETQEQRAIRAVQAIMGGANPTVEAETLANEFTDRQTAKLKKLLGRRGSQTKGADLQHD